MYLTCAFISPASVVQLKTLTSSLAVDEQLSSCSIEKTRVMQKILVYVVTIISTFMELNSNATKKSQYVDTAEHPFSKDNLYEGTTGSPKSSIPEAMISWRQKAIVLVMEAGGVNWLVGKVGPSRLYA